MDNVQFYGIMVGVIVLGEYMQKITRQPFLRKIAALFHPRFIRIENRRINKQIFAQKQAELAALGVHLEEHPEDFSRAGLFDAPFTGR